MELWQCIQSCQHSLDPAYAHTLSLTLFFFTLFKTLIASFFLCASRWKSLKMGNKTLWFYCDSILQHPVQPCTEVRELPACWQRGVLPAWFPWDRASRWWSCPASSTHAGYPVWLCPALWYLSYLLFQRWLSFYSFATLSVDLPGPASMSVWGKLALTA